MKNNAFRSLTHRLCLIIYCRLYLQLFRYLFGLFCLGLFCLGIFCNLGLFCLGLFCLGLFCLGLFCLGLFCLGLFCPDTHLNTYKTKRMTEQRWLDPSQITDSKKVTLARSVKNLSKNVSAVRLRTTKLNLQYSCKNFAGLNNFTRVERLRSKLSRSCKIEDPCCQLMSTRRLGNVRSHVKFRPRSSTILA